MLPVKLYLEKLFHPLGDGEKKRESGEEKRESKKGEGKKKKAFKSPTDLTRMMTQSWRVIDTSENIIRAKAYAFGKF